MLSLPVRSGRDDQGHCRGHLHFLARIHIRHVQEGPKLYIDQGEGRRRRRRRRRKRKESKTV